MSQELGVPWDRVHDEPEVLEHVISEDPGAADRRRARGSAARSARRSDSAGRPSPRGSADPAPRAGSVRRRDLPARPTSTARRTGYRRGVGAASACRARQPHGRLHVYRATSLTERRDAHAAAPRSPSLRSFRRQQSSGCRRGDSRPTPPTRRRREWRRAASSTTPVHAWPPEAPVGSAVGLFRSAALLVNHALLAALRRSCGGASSGLPS